MSDNATLTGVLSAVWVLTGVLTPADTGDFVADLQPMRNAWLSLMIFLIIY